MASESPWCYFGSGESLQSVTWVWGPGGKEMVVVCSLAFWQVCLSSADFVLWGRQGCLECWHICGSWHWWSNVLWLALYMLMLCSLQWWKVCSKHLMGSVMVQGWCCIKDYQSPHRKSFRSIDNPLQKQAILLSTQQSRPLPKKRQWLQCGLQKSGPNHWARAKVNSYEYCTVAVAERFNEWLTMGCGAQNDQANLEETCDKDRWSRGASWLCRLVGLLII
jgi:hypothetical protein